MSSTCKPSCHAGLHQCASFLVRPCRKTGGAKIDGTLTVWFAARLGQLLWIGTLYAYPIVVLCEKHIAV